MQRVVEKIRFIPVPDPVTDIPVFPYWIIERRRKDVIVQAEDAQASF